MCPQNEDPPGSGTSLPRNSKPSLALGTLSLGSAVGLTTSLHDLPFHSLILFFP